MANRIEGGSRLPSGTLFLELPWTIVKTPFGDIYDFRVTLPGAVVLGENERGEQVYLESTEVWDSAQEALDNLYGTFGVTK